jgi:hypothetical protein
MPRGFVLYSVLLATICAALTAGTATAAPTRRGEEVGPPVGFELQGTNGYTIFGAAYQAGYAGPAGLVLTARRGAEVVRYSTPARVTPHSIRADLGKLGRVDLALHKSGQEETTHLKCLHDSETFETGTWEGLIEFNGEEGYTRARATQAVGLPSLPLLAGGGACNRQSSGEALGARQPGARLKGSSFAGGRTIRFQVNKNRRGGETRFTASLAERERGIRIFRELSGTAPANAFHYDQRVRTATLSLPAPFSGSGHLRRSQNAVSPLWTGNLTLSFPGRSVPLAGPSFHVTLEHAKQTFGEDPNSISVGF